DILYITALASPQTVNTMPEGTLTAFANHGVVGPLLPRDGGDAEEVLGRFARAGIDALALAADLQTEGAKAFVTSWNELMAAIHPKPAAPRKPGCPCRAPAPCPAGRSGRRSGSIPRRCATSPCARSSPTTRSEASGSPPRPSGSIWITRSSA